MIIMVGNGDDVMMALSYIPWVTVSLVHPRTSFACPCRLVLLLFSQREST